MCCVFHAVIVWSGSFDGLRCWGWILFRIVAAFVFHISERMAIVSSREGGVADAAAAGDDDDDIDMVNDTIMNI